MLANITSTFPNSASQAFYKTMEGIGFKNKTLINKKNYISGRTLFVFDTRSSESEDCLNIERSGILRFNLRCSKPCRSNKSVFILGYTLGVIHINASRRVYPNYLQ